MIISRKKLRQIIKEVIISEAGDPTLPRADDEQFATVVDLSDSDPWHDQDAPRVKHGQPSYGETADYKDDGSYFRDVIVMSPNGDSVLVDGSETYVQDVPRQLELMGFPMKGNDADNLIFALEEMMADGYVELMVTYENGVWSW